MFDALLRLPGGLCRTTRALVTHHYPPPASESLRASVKSSFPPPYRSGCSTKACTTCENAARFVAKLWRRPGRRPIVTTMLAPLQTDLIASLAPTVRAVACEAGNLALASFRRGGQTSAKLWYKNRGSSPVTAADMAVDAF